MQRGRLEHIGTDLPNGLTSELDQLPPDVLDVFPAFTAARAEIGPHPVPARVLAAPHDLVRHELAIRHHRPTDTELARIIDDSTIPAIQHASHHPGPSQPGRN